MNVNIKFTKTIASSNKVGDKIAVDCGYGRMLKETACV